MAKQKANEADQLRDFVDNAEHFYEQYKFVILGVLVALIVAVGGFWVYKNMIKAPKEEKAQNAIYGAQELFARDSFALALKGDGTALGFETIASKYKGTAAGNTAKFYAGVCELQTGNFTGAIKYLEDFDTEDEILTARKFGCIGDAYAEQEQIDKAIDNYKKAIDATDNEVIAPSYIYRLAAAYEFKKDYKSALEQYKNVFDNYPNTQEASAAEMVIAKLEQMQ
ncbi:MAG: tetratricopeptide repeat protein [Chitinophagales bacterium]|nr:tetratricopeptide repeat protein [Chitinophagales bacterium]